MNLFHTGSHDRIQMTASWNFWAWKDQTCYSERKAVGIEATSFFLNSLIISMPFQPTGVWKSYVEKWYYAILWTVEIELGWIFVSPNLTIQHPRNKLFIITQTWIAKSEQVDRHQTSFGLFVYTDFCILTYTTLPVLKLNWRYPRNSAVEIRKNK